MPPGESTQGEPRTMLSFTQAAERLKTDAIVRSMSAEGLRKLARTDPEWPFGESDYEHVAGARLLHYERLVDYFRTRSKRPGRGPARKAPPAE